MTATDPAAMLHQLTQHGSPTDRSLLVDFQPLDPSNRPAPFKRYVGLETTPLPTELGESGVRATEALSGRTRPATPAPLDATTLARLLFFTAGVTRSSSTPAFEERTYFRTAMSAGNLHPVEVYAACAGIEGVPDGVHHFAPLELGLTTLRTGAVAPAPGCTLVLTGIPWRTAWKYGERGFRHLYWDAGTMLANLLAMADASALDARMWTGFVDDDVARLVGVDGVTEFPLALVSIGAPDVIDLPADLPPLDVDVERISPHPIAFPLINQAQQSGGLADAAEVTEWREHAIDGSASRTHVDPRERRHRRVDRAGHPATRVDSHHAARDGARLAPALGHGRRRTSAAGGLRRARHDAARAQPRCSRRRGRRSRRVPVARRATSSWCDRASSVRSRNSCA